MIALQRADVRRFRAVARRGRPPDRPRGPAPPCRVAAAGGTITLAAHLGDVVVAWGRPAPRPGSASVTVPLDALAACDGGAGELALEPDRRGAVTARWCEEGTGEQRAVLDPVGSDPAWPAEPDQLVAVAPHLLTALHECGRSAAREEAGRYALNRLQVRGKAGQVAGTDGKQALAWGGFAFPFAEDLVVPAVPVFGSRELAAEPAVSVGLAGDWLFLVVGPWRAWLRVDRAARFPDVRGAVPRAVGTRVEFDDLAADALLRALPDLPGGGTESRPVTLDLGPTVAVRGRDGPEGDAAEVPLPGTRAAGPPVRVVLCRDHLARALALGLRELRVSSPGRPAVFRDKDRVYLTATLDPACAVPPPAAAGPPAPATTDATTFAPSPPTPIPERRTEMPSRDHPLPDRNGHTDSPAGEPADPLAEAEALRASLAEAAGRAARLAAALKQYKRERRSLQAAWSSLRQLNLGP